MAEKITVKPRVRIDPAVLPRIQEWMHRNKIKKTNIAANVLIEHALDYLGIPDVQPNSQEVPHG